MNKKIWFTIGVILFLSGIIIMCFVASKKGVDIRPKITNEIEEWDYSIYGYKNAWWAGEDLEIPIRKLYQDSSCIIWILYNNSWVNLNSTITNLERQAYEPLYINIELNNHSDSIIAYTNYDYINKSDKFNYTCYGRFIGFND